MKKESTSLFVKRPFSRWRGGTVRQGFCFRLENGFPAQANQSAHPVIGEFFAQMRKTGLTFQPSGFTILLN